MIFISLKKVSLVQFRYFHLHAPFSFPPQDLQSLTENYNLQSLLVFARVYCEVLAILVLQTQCHLPQFQGILSCRVSLWAIRETAGWLYWGVFVLNGGYKAWPWAALNILWRWEGLG